MCSLAATTTPTDADQLRAIRLFQADRWPDERIRRTLQLSQRTYYRRLKRLRELDALRARREAER